jgi:hypothetical protein
LSQIDSIGAVPGAAEAFCRKSAMAALTQVEWAASSYEVQQSRPNVVTVFTFNGTRDFVAPNGRRSKVSGFRDDGILPLICPTCQVISENT